MIKMSEIMSEQKMKQIVERAGAEWLGIETTPSQLKVPRENLVLFNDPKTKSTLALPLSKITEENVRRKCSEKKT